MDLLYTKFDKPKIEKCKSSEFLQLIHRPKRSGFIFYLYDAVIYLRVDL